MTDQQTPKQVILPLVRKIIGLPPEVFDVLCKIVRTIIRHMILLDERRKRSLATLSTLLMTLTLTWFLNEIHSPQFAQDGLAKLFTGTCWVTYDPPTFHPLYRPNPRPSAIEKDLKRIRDAGFTGIVTFGSSGTFMEIPKLARRHDLHIIMGIWNPGNSGEVEAAIQQKDFVDGYSIGHNGLRKVYTFNELERVIASIRRRTRRPVSTSVEARFYSNDSELQTVGDWLFPDVHLSLVNDQQSDKASPRFSVDISRDVKTFLDQAHQLASRATDARRFLMLKMASYPWNGVPNASVENQAEFYWRMLESLRSPEHGVQTQVSIVFHSAFDIWWKDGFPFYPWDKYTGLLTAEGKRRPAADVILERCR